MVKIQSKKRTSASRKEADFLCKYQDKVNWQTRVKKLCVAVLLRSIHTMTVQMFFLKVCKQTFHISHERISQKLNGVLIWNLEHTWPIGHGTYYFNIKTNVLADFQIGISVPLRTISFKKIPWPFFCLLFVEI